MRAQRDYQLGYSLLHPEVTDRDSHGRKAETATLVRENQLGQPLSELRILDVGGSSGIMADFMGTRGNAPMDGISGGLISLKACCDYIARLTGAAPACQSCKANGGDQPPPPQDSSLASPLFSQYPCDPCAPIEGRLHLGPDWRSKQP